MGLNSGLEKQAAKPKTMASVTEPEMLYEKSYICPVCEAKLKIKTMKQSKARLVKTERDMRPIYNNVDPVKYGAILCNVCGYAAMINYFDKISDTQIRLIEENISSKYTGHNKLDGEIYSYDEALDIHKMALLNTMVKKGKASEKAYVCLKIAWLLRGKAESLKKEQNISDEEITQLKTSEMNYLAEAYKGFIDAIQTESSTTICGMNDSTLSYLCAALAYEIGEYEESQRMISKVFAMPETTKTIKDKCIDLKELLSKVKNKDKINNEKSVLTL